jgi:Xaa-Pro aminopeptidase
MALAMARMRFEDALYRDRLARAAAEAGARDIDALLITPSADYTYLLGYEAPALERLTCLVVPARGEPALVLPRLEEPLARHHLGALADEIELLPWDETDDPFWAVRGRLEGGVMRVGVQDQMWARFVLRLRAALDPTELVVAGSTLGALRSVKSPEEIERLRRAAQAADAAMDAIRREPFAGRTEADVSSRIRELLVEFGHDVADFAIVGSGPNSASGHHTPGERVIRDGDAVVLDIGGYRAWYGSDTTRTVFVGEPDAEFSELYDVLYEAQQAARDAVCPGVPAQDVDRAARNVIADAGFGTAFVHRTGHGIGMEVHEEPYIVEGNAEPLVAGNAFSIEPGIYIEGRWGARIEDIVVCTPDGGESINQSSRELLIVG